MRSREREGGEANKSGLLSWSLIGHRGWGRGRSLRTRETHSEKGLSLFILNSTVLPFPSNHSDNLRDWFYKGQEPGRAHSSTLTTADCPQGITPTHRHTLSLSLSKLSLRTSEEALKPENMTRTERGSQ